MTNTSFIMRGYYLDELDEYDKEKYTKYIINYGLYGQEPDFETMNGIEKLAWQFIKNNIDRDNKEMNKIIKL